MSRRSWLTFLVAPTFIFALQPGSAAASATSGKQPPGDFLHVNAAARTVDVLLVGGDGASNNGFNFDGYGRGELIVRVPRGWMVRVTCRDSGAPRSSCAVVSGPSATTPAFRGASTTSPVIGLVSGQAESFMFRAARVGTYRLASLVPGQELARMFDVLVVTSGGRPSIAARPGP